MGISVSQYQMVAHRQVEVYHRNELGHHQKWLWWAKTSLNCDRNNKLLDHELTIYTECGSQYLPVFIEGLNKYVCTMN